MHWAGDSLEIQLHGGKMCRLKGMCFCDSFLYQSSHHNYIYTAEPPLLELLLRSGTVFLNLMLKSMCWWSSAACRCYLTFLVKWVSASNYWDFHLLKWIIIFCSAAAFQKAATPQVHLSLGPKIYSSHFIRPRMRSNGRTWRVYHHSAVLSFAFACRYRDNVRLHAKYCLHLFEIHTTNWVGWWNSRRATAKKNVAKFVNVE